MADIKTREKAAGTIKTLDRAKAGTRRIKNATVHSKETAEKSVDTPENSPEKYATDKVSQKTKSVADTAVRQFDKQGRKSIDRTKHNVQKAKDNFGKTKDNIQKSKENLGKAKGGVKKLKRERVAQNIRTKAQNTKNSIRTAQKASQSIKQSAKSTGKQTIKSAQRSTVKTAKSGIKTAERGTKITIKTSKQAAKAAKESAKASAKIAKKSAQAAKAAAKASAQAAKATAKAVAAAIKAIIAGIRALIAAIAAGGWVAVVIIIVIVLIAAILASVFGIFFSGEDSGTGMTMQTAVSEINSDYEAKIKKIKDDNKHDELEMKGSRAVWKEVLAVYAVKVNLNGDESMEVCTMDENKKGILKDIFWDMNSISHEIKTKTVTVREEKDDGHGNIVVKKKKVKKKYLYITITHKTTTEMADKYKFTDEQRKYLKELLSDKYSSLWSSVLYGVSYSSDDGIVKVALEQVGNVGGQPYWSWYGFSSRVDWCACFVSWCANECGYITDGIIPKYALCSDGSNWFKSHGQWLKGGETPSAGMIIFFDYPDDGLDGSPDHTAIVEKVKDGRVYTVEGNYNDKVATDDYAISYPYILGYGVPQY
jgi:uncharacterized MAPEG superfamily protein